MATTASALGAFRRELETERFRPDVVNELVYIMARSLMAEEIVVNAQGESSSGRTNWDEVFPPSGDMVWKLPRPSCGDPA